MNKCLNILFFVIISILIAACSGDEKEPILDSGQTTVDVAVDAPTPDPGTTADSGPQTDPGASQPETITPPDSVTLPDSGTPEDVDGMMVYGDPVEGGNTFTCYTCHALKEPAPNGIRRAGHEIGNATKRSSWKNGNVDSMLGAVNSCLTEWMNAEPWTEEDPRWLALYEFLDSMATEETAEPIVIQVVMPPTDLSGGDAEAGHELFNHSCSMCHGQDALGTDLAPPLGGTQWPAAYIASRIRTSGLPNSPVYEGLTGGKMPFWGEDRISNDELRDIVQWVTTSEINIPLPETLCDTYCGLADTNCTGENSIDWGDSDCQTQCAAYDMSGLNGATSGDTVQCRIYHLGDPAAGEPAIHCPHGSPDGGGVCVVPTDPELCGNDHPKVGQVAILQNHFHGIGGTATITDNCTIEVVDFDFDGNGINVQIYAATGGNYANGFSISPNLKNFPVGYNKASLTLDLGDHTLDEVDGISVWCVPVGLSFGDGLFE